MRNKLKRSKNCTDVCVRSREEPSAAEASTEDRTAPRDTSGSNVPPAAGASAGRVKPLHEQDHFSTEDIKIAPIFLRKTQRDRSKPTSDGQPERTQQKSLLPPQNEEKQQVKGQLRMSTLSHLTNRRGSRRGQLLPSALHSCLDEISTSNPAFPVRPVFSSLQKKTGLQDFGCSEKPTNLKPPQTHPKEKRKREKDSCEQEPKRLRASLLAEDAAAVVHTSEQGVQESCVLRVSQQHRSHKLSRSRSLRRRSGSSAGLVIGCELYSAPLNHTEAHNRSPETCDVLQTDSSFEDVLWTDKYSPQCASEVLGNSASVNRLHSWLRKWKLKADSDERRKMEEKKEEENSNDSWDCGDFQGEAGTEDNRGEETLCNAMLITGPPGVGKTAAVYACSQELGFKVFEVNCSSQRSGRHLLSQLKEVTQSHLVEMSGKDPLKPAFFNNYSCNAKSEILLAGKTVPLKNATSSLKKRAVQNFGRRSRKGKGNPAAITLAKYFKMKAKADHLHFGGLSPSEQPDSKTSYSPSSGPDQTVQQNKKTATSLILFEEVDVIFDDDVGFLAAIKTFMTTTKRPVVLTTNDPLFRERFNCSLEEIIFKTPSELNTCSYLQLVALAENVRLDLSDAGSLLRQCGGDVRRCLLQLQLWVHSGGGRAPRAGGCSKEPSRAQDSNVTEREEDSQLPQCDTGCSGTMLGLQPETQNQLLNYLKCRFWSESDTVKLLRLLAESWRAGVPLLYSNLELLLPSGARETSVHFLDKRTCSGLQRELASPDVHIQLLDGNRCPKAPAGNSSSVRNISRLSRRKYSTVLDTTSCSSKTPAPKTLSSSERAHSQARCSRDESEHTAAKVEPGALNALTDFFDLMSYLDATVPAAHLLASGSCTPEAFIWTGAEIKDGLLDETSEEQDGGRSWSQERHLDIQAAVEGLGCHRCLQTVSHALTGAQNYGQQLGLGDTQQVSQSLVPPKRQSFSFSVGPLCSPSVSQRRWELSRTVLGGEPFSLLGNRRAVCVDYMPALRHICRFQRDQRQKGEPSRCLNYLCSKQLGLPKSTVRLLAQDFS